MIEYKKHSRWKPILLSSLGDLLNEYAPDAFVYDTIEMESTATDSTFPFELEALTPTMQLTFSRIVINCTDMGIYLLNDNGDQLHFHCIQEVSTRESRTGDIVVKIMSGFMKHKKAHFITLTHSRD